jgi:hypothetical protein
VGNTSRRIIHKTKTGIIRNLYQVITGKSLPGKSRADQGSETGTILEYGKN